MAKQVRTRSLATGANTNATDLNEGKFQLGTGRLTQVTLTGGRINQGPVLGNALVEFNDSVTNRLPLGSPIWLRGNSTFGHSETFHWEGEIEVDPRDHLLVAVRNDSGAEFIWVLGWTID